MDRLPIKGEGFVAGIGGFEYLRIGPHRVHHEWVQHWVMQGLQGMALTPIDKMSEDDLRGKPSDIEVIAERLAKVEEGLTRLAVPADNFGSLLTRLDAVDAQLDTQSELRVRSNRTLDQRIDKVAEIIGERVSGLADEIAAARDSAKRAHERLDDFGARRTADIKTEPAFPTGGADTAEGATEAVLPVPQRGDRVRLEGAKSTGGTTLTGWYEVTGRYEQHFPGDHAQFQIGSVGSMGLYWVYDTDPGLKEVRHAADNI